MNSDNYISFQYMKISIRYPPLQPSLPIPPVPSPPLPTAAPLRADRRREVVMTRVAGGHGGGMGIGTKRQEVEKIFSKVIKQKFRKHRPTSSSTHA